MADDLVWLVSGMTEGGEHATEIVARDGGRVRHSYVAARFQLCRRELAEAAAGVTLRPMVAEPFEAVARRATDALAGERGTTL